MPPVVRPPGAGGRDTEPGTPGLVTGPVSAIAGAPARTHPSPYPCAALVEIGETDLRADKWLARPTPASLRCVDGRPRGANDPSRPTRITRLGANGRSVLDARGG